MPRPHRHPAVGYAPRPVRRDSLRIRGRGEFELSLWKRDIHRDEDGGRVDSRGCASIGLCKYDVYGMRAHTTIIVDI